MQTIQKLTIFTFFLISVFSSAQEVKVKGQIKDQSGEEVAFAKFNQKEHKGIKGSQCNYY